MTQGNAEAGLDQNAEAEADADAKTATAPEPGGRTPPRSDAPSDREPLPEPTGPTKPNPKAPSPHRRRFWVWAALGVLILPAIWLVTVFPRDVDTEFPWVERPYFSEIPPPAYRWAEPGDSLDRVALYLAAACAGAAIARGLAGGGWGRSAVSTIGLGLGVAWLAAASWPTFDGWHGWSPFSAFDPKTPANVRTALLALLALVAALALGPWLAAPRRAIDAWRGLARGERAWLVLFALGLTLRLANWPPVEPIGYWPRWALIWGTAALLGFTLLRLPAPRGLRARLGLAAGGAVVAAGIVAGLEIVEYHRPLIRFKEAVPGRIFISGMPTGRGLEIAHARHGFKTIINLFQEDLFPDRRNPEYDRELEFARSRGLAFLQSPKEFEASDRFLFETLRVARDPNAWPILIHCHGCMDRTPAWLGIYRFVFEGRSIRDVIEEIERHRGLRPKGSVVLLYNRVLPYLAPERFAADPSSKILRDALGGRTDPYYADFERRAGTKSFFDPTRPRADGEPDNPADAFEPGANPWWRRTVD